MHTVVVGLGANLGSREAYLRAAVGLLEARGDIAVQEISRLYRTEPIGPPQPDFLNAAVRVRTALPVESVLERTAEVENRLGRQRDERWGARTVDLDLLWSDAGERSGPELTVPHARLTERAFALAPLLDVAPELSERYGPALERLGGAPGSSRSWELRPWWSSARLAEQSTEPSERVRVEAVGEDEPDAMASLAAGVAARLDASAEALEVRTEDLPSAEQEAPAAAVVRTVLGVLRGGFGIREAPLEPRPSGVWGLRLVGAPGRPVSGVVLHAARLEPGRSTFWGEATLEFPK
jgi:2-amino-4-hydroxy-6-hydroxymethyldihydropteridine diphosphokinase